MSPYRIVLSTKSQKQLRKLNPQIRTKIVVEIKKLADNHFPPQFKALTGKTVADYRLRIGDYRVLYDVYDSDRTILIIVVGHRREIYR